MQCSAILISAPASGQGKTLVSAAMARAWCKQGLSVQAFKCGPDFIDSMILQTATGRPVYNLDLGMCGLEDAKAQLHRAALEMDVILIEGVMGLYDGTPSTADIAQALNIPVALVIDAGGMAQTFAAVASGLYTFNHALLSAGVVANKVGSTGHAKLLQSSMPDDIPWIGCLHRDKQLSLPERHLGLHLAGEITDLEARIDTAADALSNDQALTLPPVVSFDKPNTIAAKPLLKGKIIAVARDAAFCFIYQANIDCLALLGATVIYYSLLDDDSLPEADAYWIPGGYPELHLERISQNTAMRSSLEAACNNNKPILAECGGMMALSKSLNGIDAFGLLEGDSLIMDKLQGLGTQHLEVDNSIIGAHTFHYGVFNTTLEPMFIANSKFGKGEAVYQHRSITASFLHFYFPSNHELTAQFFSS